MRGKFRLLNLDIQYQVPECKMHFEKQQFKMLVLFSPTFLGGTNIIFCSNLGAPLKMRDFYRMGNFTLFPKLKLRIQLSISIFLIFIFIFLHLYFVNKILTLSRRRPLSYRNQTDIYMITASVLQGLNSFYFIAMVLLVEVDTNRIFS